MVHVHLHGALLALGFYLFAHAHNKVVAVYALQYSLELVAFLVHHLYFIANVVDILLMHLKGLTDARRAHFKLIVFLIPVEMSLDEAAQVLTVVYPHTIGMVYFNHDFVIRADLQVHQKVLLTFQPLVNQAFYHVFIYHRFRVYK